MLRIGTRILPANREDHHAWAMSAYGLAQCNRLAEAEAHARRAIELERRDPCAHQVVAQCLQARGRLLEGVTFLQSVADTWDACHSSMYTHNWWQLALLLIELDQSREALALFDQRVWGVRKSFCADQVNAVSLLAWLELRGVDVGRRWDDVAAHLETRLHEHFSPLLDLHYVHGLARAGRTHAATEMLASLEDRAERATAAEREAWADCAVPMAHGLVGYAKSDFAGAARLMGRAMPHLRAIGGGIDRRGLFAALHLDALIKSGWNDAALAILQAHERARPAVPSIKLALGDLYRRLGRSEQALLAEHQAARLACPPRQVAGAASGTPGASGGQPGCAALPEA
jgi:tetratricopeptide (TPR) repeat protein